MTVYNCTFNRNNSTLWAGAIHTHTNSDTLIVGSSFTDNIAGYNNTIRWNCGALFSYGKLVVINSTFTDNKCNVTTGGGAIYGYSYSGSTYNITVDSCNFTHNVSHSGMFPLGPGPQAHVLISIISLTPLSHSERPGRSS